MIGLMTMMTRSWPQDAVFVELELVQRGSIAHQGHDLVAFCDDLDALHGLLRSLSADPLRLVLLLLRSDAPSKRTKHRVQVSVRMPDMPHSANSIVAICAAPTIKRGHLDLATTTDVVVKAGHSVG